MPRLLQWTVIFSGGLLIIVLLAGAGVFFSTSGRLNKTYTVQPEPVSIPSDEASLAEGKRLASIYCASCHGEDMAGTDFFNDPALAVVDAPNLTSGSGGVGSAYRDTDWVRAIRHGVDPQGKALFIMPAKDFYHFSDEDLGQIIAYLKSVPPVDRDSDDRSFGLIGRVLLAAGAFGDIIHAETIDHDGSRPAAPLPGKDATYGEYLVKTFGCATCHGEALAGGPNPEPGLPPGPNLTPGSSLAGWSEQVFITNIRGRQSEYMPYESLAKMTDDELGAIYLYLSSLPPMETAAK